MVQTEIEVKAHLPNERLVKKLLDNADFIGTKIVIDKYLDTKKFDFFQLGVFIRIRNNKTFDIKYNNKILDTSHLNCQEYNFSYPLSVKDESYVFQFLNQFIKPKSNNPLNLFDTFGLIEFVVIEKERSVYKGKGIEIAIDNVHELGKFIEIEALDSIPDNVLAVFSDLNLQNIPTGYVELYLRKNQFAVYKKGRYKLPIDEE